MNGTQDSAAAAQLDDLEESVISRLLNAPDVTQAPHVRPETLVSLANVHVVAFGTGHQIYQSIILPAIEKAQDEVILVTCFWAASPTLNDLNHSLRKLSARAVQDGRKIRVRICFSSSSLWQKLCQTSSLSGRTWKPSTWRVGLDLPSPEEVPGLDMAIKSVFQLPFSIMHPKFVVVDRRVVFLPSCNVSWEEWFEGCVSLGGEVVQLFVRSWLEFWAEVEDREVLLTGSHGDLQHLGGASRLSTSLLSTSDLEPHMVHSMFLPSPHHRFNLPWLTSDRPPPTPLNIYLLTLVARAEKNIYLQTPNLTMIPFITALLEALDRGVDVTIITSRNLMVLEQLVTAGTTTTRCVQRMMRSHERLARNDERKSANLEAGLLQPRRGRLVIKYYEPRAETSPYPSEPKQSHLKLTMVDDKIAIFGSGNMDRASWHTSQELGVAFTSPRVVGEVSRCLGAAMQGRSVVCYDSLTETVR
ncbi:hypothetical protein LTR62_006748 [Meristemomyces frigidus]|uniref:PLD phosphodiesterase domain-containing protein n=1 Tax=Meristemomyces frigidus TaxID=1508187 RepID=A0AAN7TIL3_9PEZI|nr:hypothetical protein LTR62_006748 [Meristemomyces frigidus]